MKRARSLFEIDQEPLFETGSLEADDGTREQVWHHSYHDPPSASATVACHAAEAPSPWLGGGRRVLVVVAAMGVAGFVGSPLTQVAGTPTLAPHTAATSRTPAFAAPVADSARARRPQVTRTRRARSAAASRGPEASRPRPPTGTAGRARRPSPPAAAPLPAVPAPALRYAPPPPPEPQGFRGEFF